MTEIAIQMPCPHWALSVPDAEALCRRAAAAALAAGLAEDDGIDPARAEISLVLADDDTVRALNRTWRDRDEATNVLSFAALDDDEAPLPEDGPILLGDVILAYQTTLAEAARDGLPFAAHLSHLVVHGVLHLLGWDHQDDGEADQMERLEGAIMQSLGLPDPYDQPERRP